MTYVTPVPQDMATRIGYQVDTARATAVIADAELLAKDIVTPLPTSAATVVLAAAIRAYSNITGAVSEITGPSQVSHGPAAAAGVFLTKSERAALRRAAGLGGAFTVDLLAGRTWVEEFDVQIAEDPLADLLGGTLGGAVDPTWGFS